MACPFDIYSCTALASGYPANALISRWQKWRAFLRQQNRDTFGSLLDELVS